MPRWLWRAGALLAAGVLAGGSSLRAAEAAPTDRSISLATARWACEAALTAAETIVPPAAGRSGQAEKDVVRCSIAVRMAQTGAVAEAKALALRLSRKPFDEQMSALGDIAVVQAEAGDVAGAKETVAEINGAFRRSDTLRRVAKAQAKMDKAGAGITFAEAQAAAESSDGKDGAASSLCQIAEDWREAGDAAGAEACFAAAERWAKLAEPHWINTALCRVARARADAGDIEGARKTAREIADGKELDEARAVIGKAEAEGNDFAAAQRTLATLGRPSERAMVLKIIAIRQAKLGDVAGAFATAGAMTEGSERSWALVRIAQTLAKGGDTARALVTLESVNDHQIRSAALVWVAGTLAERGEMAAATSTAASITVPKSRAYAWIEMGIAGAKAGDGAEVAASFAEARRQAAAVQGSERRELWRSLAGTQAAAEGLAAVERWTLDLSDPTCRACALIGIADTAIAQSQGRRWPAGWGKD